VWKANKWANPFCPDFERCNLKGMNLPPAPKPDPDLELVTVLATGNPALIAVAKSLLEDSGIEYATQNEGLHDLFPVNRFRVHIQVRQEDEAEATALLSALEEE
jgi:hypothetical protein